jgi:hypothetical protein
LIAASTITLSGSPVGTSLPRLYPSAVAKKANVQKMGFVGNEYYMNVF